MTEAWGAYARAAAAARITVRELDGIVELQRAEQVLAGIWGVPDNPPLGAEVMRAMRKAEGYVAGAFDETEGNDGSGAEGSGGEMVGVCVGFHSVPAARTMHSHIAGVVPAMAGRHAGLALKLHQRAWCLEHGITLMEWTFDPLVARNAYFNLAKLGARVAEYLPDFYGSMADGINDAEDASDRILVHWELDSPEVAAACSGRPVEVADVPGGSWVEVPGDIEALRITDPATAREWRTKVREQLLSGLESGHVAGFHRDKGYLLVERGPDTRTGTTRSETTSTETTSTEEGTR
ncbi:GNAT family N-acetyltransferase [Nocardioides sp. CCNWLW239]|uniref:GNAT family N-acetyltransferase n=1 Tax=Nocardioides sp. CCNWLW239 TaxID=3128902 RepID=UPI003019890A